MYSTDASLLSARREANSACTQVENIGSSMASMPHYMSKGVNEMTAASVEKAVHGLMKMLEMSVTGVEEILIFVIHMFTSTYLSLLTLAVGGSMKLAVEVATKMQKVLDDTVGEATEDIGSAVSTVTKGINSVMDAVNIPFIGDKPEINVDGPIEKLRGIKLPDDMMNGIKKMNDSIPNFAEVENATNNAIRLPFLKVKELIKSKDTFQFERALLPVSQKEKLNFCSEGNSINNFFDDLLQMVSNARKLSLGLLIAAAILVCAPMAWQEIRRYRKMQERAALFDEGHDKMDVVYLASRPTSSGMGLWFGRRFGSTRQQAAIRWAWAYATSEKMLFVLSLGVAGLLSCLGQYLVLKAVEDKAPELTEQVAGFAEKVVLSINNASMSWATGINGAVRKVNDDINEDVFGWVNETTSALNNTINVFTEKMSQTIETAFGDTPLKDLVEDIVHSLDGLKIAGIEKALTWAHDNAHISFPAVRNDTFSLASLADKSGSSSASELLADPSGKAADEISEAVNHVIEKMMNGIQTEALISTGLIVLWLLFVIGGCIYAAVQAFRGDASATRAYNIDAVDSEPKEQDHDAAAPPSYVANDYNVNKGAPYTLSSRPFPTFDAEPESEKVGQVTAHRAVNSSSRPGHLRTSSHGDLADPSPLEDRSNPFSDNQYPREK
jgi:hypothetical protein